MAGRLHRQKMISRKRKGMAGILEGKKDKARMSKEIQKRNSKEMRPFHFFDF
jgi:hypothetical protein